MKIINLHKNQTHIIAKAAKNNRQAQHQIYQLYAPKMLSVCRMYIKDLHQAEEVMLDGFYKVFIRLKDFNNHGSFEGWIRRIMVRQSIDFLRKKTNMIFDDDSVIDTPGQSEIQWKYDVQHIQQAIDTLPEGYKAVFNLYAIEGFKHDEIASMLNIAEGTSKSQLHKARKMLQEKLTTGKSKNYGTK